MFITLLIVLSGISEMGFPMDAQEYNSCWSSLYLQSFSGFIYPILCHGYDIFLIEKSKWRKKKDRFALHPLYCQELVSTPCLPTLTCTYQNWDCSSGAVLCLTARADAGFPKGECSTLSFTSWWDGVTAGAPRSAGHAWKLGREQAHKACFIWVQIKYLSTEEECGGNSLLFLADLGAGSKGQSHSCSIPVGSCLGTSAMAVFYPSSPCSQHTIIPSCCLPLLTHCSCGLQLCRVPGSAGESAHCHGQMWAWERSPRAASSPRCKEQLQGELGYSCIGNKALNRVPLYCCYKLDHARSI